VGIPDVLQLTPHSRIGAFAPRSASSIIEEVESADNPAPAKSDDSRYALKPVRVRECQTLYAISLMKELSHINITNEQISLLTKEGYIASTSIGYGLNALSKAGIYAQGEYYQAFFQLSIGFERLMKLIIIQYYRGTNKSFPSNNILKSYGHDLLGLYETIGRFDSSDQSVIVPETSYRILVFLSEFAKITRYYNLDTLTGRQQRRNPLEEWSEIQEEISTIHTQKRKIKSEINEHLLAGILDDIGISMVFNEKNELIRSPGDLLKKASYHKHVQKYSVYYTYQLIHKLAKTLDKTESQYGLFPYLWEFFTYFLGGLSKAEIRNKKNWIRS